MANPMGIDLGASTLVRRCEWGKCHFSLSYVSCCPSEVLSTMVSILTIAFDKSVWIVDVFPLINRTTGNFGYSLIETVMY